jgi:tetratricopeptide (TPR) repeat protein
MDCKYHPDLSASWYCQRCDIPLCMDCLSDTSPTPRCTLCRSYLTPLGISDAIKPFWLKLGDFFVYPLAQPLLVAALIAAFVFALFFDPQSMSLLSLPLLLIWSAFVTKVMFSIMEYTAFGHLDAPDWPKMMALENGWMFIKLMAMILVVSVGLYQLTSVSWILTIALILFVVVAYPAMNMILCMDKSMWSALNPARILYVMTSIGGAYWILLGITFAFYLTLGFGSGFLLDNLPSFWGMFLSQLFYLYISFAMYHMLGYVIYQYHFELDFSVHRHTLHKNIASHGKHSLELAPKDTVKTPQPVIKEAQIFIQEGRYSEAEAVLIDALKKDPTEQSVYELLYKLFALQGKTHFMTQLCEKHLTLLMEQGSGNLMRLHYLNTVEQAPDYIPQNPAIVHRLIKLLNRRDDAKQALKLLNHLRKHHIDYSGLADACFEFGKYLTEKHNKRQEAAKIIRWGCNLAKGELKIAMQNYAKLLD